MAWVDDDVVHFKVAATPDFGGDPCAAEANHLPFDECSNREVVRMVGENRPEALNQDLRGAIWIQVCQKPGGGEVIDFFERANA